jgi:glycosyltransferase involved in cell wall biosynthesis
MQVLISVENRYEYGPDGCIYAEGPGKYSFWSSFLSTFDEVLVLARVGAQRGAVREEARADGPRVSFCALPDYRGPWQYLWNRSSLEERVREAVTNCDAYILRVPGLVGRLAWREIRRQGKRYALEVVGDPWDAFGPSTWPSLLRPVFRRAATRNLKTMCRGAMAVHYVTQEALQKRYPASKDAYVAGFSDALMDSAFASPAIQAERFRRVETIGGSAKGGVRFRVGFIGSLSQLYKGPDVLLRATALCREGGLDIETVLAGDGRYAGAMKALARQLGIEERAKFLGQLPFGEAVLSFLDSVDLFAMPSRAEGLPRALLEAMARGCPCVASDIGGIPELLPPASLVPPGNPKALAMKIMEAAGNTERLKRMAEENLAKAREFSPEQLKDVRHEFCRFVRDYSEVRASGSRSVGAL